MNTKEKMTLFAASIFYMEVIYHIFNFGMSMWNPWLVMFVSITIAALCVVTSSIGKERYNRVMTWVCLGCIYVFFASQMVYIHVFKQPLLLMAILYGASDAASNYWREALVAISESGFKLFLLALPLAIFAIVSIKKKFSYKRITIDKVMTYILTFVIGILGYVSVLFIGKINQSDFYEMYSENYGYQLIAEEMGILPAFHRANVAQFINLDAFLKTEEMETEQVETEASESEVTEVKPEESTSEETQVEGDTEESTELEDIVVDFTEIGYTGMFEGYNIIFLTAEGFSPYAVDEEITPTLYKLIHEGFVFTDFYAPLWQTSTSDGEYVNLTGLIPDQQFSMKRSADIEMPYTLAHRLEEDGYTNIAYHNNTLSYYDRHLSHPNLGYEFRASKLGSLDEEIWGSSVFEMEGVNEWPSSDYNMMVATLPEYIDKEPFHIYYMTVSGHMNYNFTGNMMSYKNKDAVQELPYSEEAKAYIACHVELDKALEYLITTLDEEGILDHTVICMSTDHYPYGMSTSALEELAGGPIENLDIYKNNLILWNSEMETVTIDKPASPVDILPTLLNLFGKEYDEELYAGRDLLSDTDPLVIFADRSFITDQVIYIKQSNQIINRTEKEVTEEYVAAIKEEVNRRYKLSATILNNGYDTITDKE